MKLNCRAGVLAAVLVSGTISPIASPQSSEPERPPAAASEAMRTLVREIKQCGEEKEMGDDPDHGGVYMIGGPINVIWDIKRVDSIRSPFQAFVEFSTPVDSFSPIRAGVLICRPTKEICFKVPGLKSTVMSSMPPIQALSSPGPYGMGHRSGSTRKGMTFAGSRLLASSS